MPLSSESAQPLGPYPAHTLFGRMGMAPWAALVLLTVPLVVVGTVVGMLSGLVVAAVAYGAPLDSLLKASTDGAGSPETLAALKWMQGGSQIVGLALVAWLLARGTGSAQRELALGRPSFTANAWALLVLVVVLGLAGLPAFSLPRESTEVLGPLGQWLKAQETSIEAMLEKLLAHDLVLNLFIVAVVPAVAEEFIFRGWMQASLGRHLSIHAAIWITAVVFSSIHLQPVGFVQRMLLGAGLGYLRVWSGSLWPSVFAHFLNNAIAVTAGYFALNGLAPRDLATSDFMPPLEVTAPAAVLLGVAWWALYRATRRPLGPTFAPKPTTTE